MARKREACGHGVMRLAVMVVVSLLGTAGLACSGDNSDSATPIETATATQRPTIILPLGRTGTSEGAEITLHRVRRSNEAAGVRPPAGMEWLLAELTVRNTSDEPFTLQIRFRDRDLTDLDRAHPPGVEAALDSPISPGEEVHGEVAFLAPAGLVGGTIIYGPGDYRWALQLGMYPIDE